MWAVLSPFLSKREGDGSLFCDLTRRKFFLRLSMISLGQFYVTERFCNFLKRHNLLIKLQPWLTFLWTTFCPCFLYSIPIHYNFVAPKYQCLPFKLNSDYGINNNASTNIETRWFFIYINDFRFNKQKLHSQHNF